MPRGLAGDLDYSHSSASPVRRLVRRVAGTRPGGWVFARCLRHFDDLVGRLTRGRHSVTSLFTGLAVLDVTTTGRRSGTPRTSHLIATPYDDTLALLGTNFGQASTPAWVLNLEADPRATLTYRGRTRAVTARPATPQETEEIFVAAARFYPGYASYRERVGSSRRIRAFVLTSPDEGRPDGP